MRRTITALVLLIISVTSTAWDEFVQKDLKVGVNKYSGKSIYFQGKNGDLYLETYSGSEGLEAFVFKEGTTGKLTLKGNAIYYKGKKMQAPILFKGEFDSEIQLSLDGKEFSTYRGDMEFIVYKEKIMPINSIQSEEYIYSVVPSEIGHYFPKEAIKAQVLAARTYLYHGLSNYKYDHFDLLDNVNSQMYLGKNRENLDINKLVDSTQGEIITYNDKPINALYYSTSGGRTANNEDVWNGKPIAYLRGKKDTANESKSSRKSWSKAISKSELSNKVGFNVKKIKIIKKASNRVHTLELIGSNKKKRISGDELRRLVGYNKLYSTQFKVKDSGSSFRFEGRGSGHGVGMSQYGAYGLASSGKTYKDIINHYYTNVKIKKLKND